MKNLTWLSPELFITSVPTEKSNDRELSSHNWVLWVKANIFVNEAFLSYPICTTIWWLVRNSLMGMWDDYRFLDKSQMLLLTCRYLAKQIGWPMNRKYNLEIGCLTTDPQAKILNLWWGVLICCGFLLVIKWTLKLRRIDLCWLAQDICVTLLSVTEKGSDMSHINLSKQVLGKHMRFDNFFSCPSAYCQQISKCLFIFGPQQLNHSTCLWILRVIWFLCNKWSQYFWNSILFCFSK